MANQHYLIASLDLTATMNAGDGFLEAFAGIFYPFSREESEPMTPRRPVEPDTTIARYYSAYAHANGADSKMPKIQYERGWFVFASIGFGQCQKFRRRAFEDMISRLAHVPAAE